MTKVTVFSINTTFHLMLSKFYIKNNHIENPVIICNSLNEEISKIVKNDHELHDVLIIKRNMYSKHRLKRGVQIRSEIVKTKFFLKSKDIKELFVFKDNDTINQVIIESVYKRNIDITLIEDGLGLYTLTQEESLISKHSFFRRILFKYPEYILNGLGFNPKVKNILASSPEEIPEKKTKGKSIKKLNIEEITTEEIDSLFNYFNTNNYEFPLSVSGKSKTILYLGQPLSENNLLSKDSEIKTINLLITSLLKSKNVRIIIKPHPSDNLEKYQSFSNNEFVKIYEDNHIPAELLTKSLEIDIVLAVHSTSCFYIKNWYDIHSYSLYNIFFKKPPNAILLEKITKMYKMKIVNDLDELIGLVKK